MITLICKQCNKSFQEKPYRLSVAKYCSRKCYGISERGKVPKSAWRKNQHISPKTQFKSGKNHRYFGISSGAFGKHWKLTIKTRHKMSMARRGSSYPSPSTRDANKIHPNYHLRHKWIYQQFGKPDNCEFCGKKGLSGLAIQWANKSGKYLKNRSDWLRLCKDCHRVYDAIKLISKSSLSIIRFSKDNLIN